MNKKEELHRRITEDGFNEITAHFTQDGDLILHLSHRATNDKDVLVRVAASDDIELCGMTDVPPEAWEDETTRVGRINKGGNWFYRTIDAAPGADHDDVGVQR